MTPEELEHVLNIVRSTIKDTVNGKIDRIDLKLENYIKSDNEWKTKADPILEMGRDLRSFGKIVAVILGIVATVFGIIKFWK